MNAKLTLHGPIPVAGFIQDGKITLERPWLLVPPKPETVLAHMIERQQSRRYSKRYKAKKGKP